MRRYSIAKQIRLTAEEARLLEQLASARHTNDSVVVRQLIVEEYERRGLMDNRFAGHSVDVVLQAATLGNTEGMDLARTGERMGELVSEWLREALPGATVNVRFLERGQDVGLRVNGIDATFGQLDDVEREIADTAQAELRRIWDAPEDWVVMARPYTADTILDRVIVTAANIDNVRATIGPTDQRAEVEIGDTLTYQRLYQTGRAEPVDVTIYHDKQRVAVARGGDSEWGDYIDGQITPDDQDSDMASLPIRG
jgi:hypothetical protein